MAQERWPTLCGDVGLMLKDLPPVRCVAQRSYDVGPERSDLVRQEDDGEERDGREQEEQRREEAPRTAQVKLSKAHPTPVPLLGEEQRCDQVPADHEEHVDTEEPAGHPTHVGVVEQHGRHAERAEPVESGDVPQPTTRRRGPLGRACDQDVVDVQARR